MFITLSLSDTFILFYYINFLNITPKLHIITTVVTVDLQTAFLMWYIDVIMMFLYATLYLPSSTGTLIIAVRLKYKEIYVPTMLVQSCAAY